MTDSTQTVERLLEHVSGTVNKSQEENKETGIAYNVFKVMLRDKKEVRMCRVLADLLNPKGQHYRGNVYLKLFMEKVVKPLIEKKLLIKKAGELNLEKANVISEYRIDEDRRIDIVLDDRIIFLPIEVKFKASEGENQLSDYAAFSKIMNADTDFIPVLFLTPDGRESSEETSKDNYIPISFEKHIIPWLEECLNIEETSKALPVKEVLKQYINAIKSFCGSEDETMGKTIEEIIMESNNYETALLVRDTVNKLSFKFKEKAREIFKGEICKLVKDELSDTGYYDDKDEDWHFINFTVAYDCVVDIDFSLKSIMLDFGNLKKDDVETVEKISNTMSRITRCRNGNWSENHIWASKKVEYPGLERKDDDEIYNYKLYQIYLNEPEKVAKWIVDMANELNKI